LGLHTAMLSVASYHFLLMGALAVVILVYGVLVVWSLLPNQLTVRSTDAAGNTGQDQSTWTVNPPVDAQTR
jgi:hypothetical protein